MQIEDHLGWYGMTVCHNPYCEPADYQLRADGNCEILWAVTVESCRPMPLFTLASHPETCWWMSWVSCCNAKSDAINKNDNRTAWTSVWNVTKVQYVKQTSTRGVFGMTTKVFHHKCRPLFKSCIWGELKSRVDHTHTPQTEAISMILNIPST